jgi:hypothetical protein
MIKWKGLPWFFIFNGKKRQESGIVERPRESMCERQSIVIEEK